MQLQAMHIKKSFIFYRHFSIFSTSTPIDTTRTALALTAMVLYAALLYAVLQLFVSHCFSVQVWSGTWLRDACAHVMFGSLLYSIARSWKMWAISFSMLTAVLQVSNALKLNVLGSPVMPDDFLAFTNMLHLFSDWRLYAMSAAVGVPLLTLLAAIAWTRKSTWMTLGSLTVFYILIFANAPDVTAYMDKRYGDWVWNQPGNYKDRGLVRHLVHEGVRNMARGKTTAGREEALTALNALHTADDAPAAHGQPSRTPNIYIILLESFWDPMLLDDSGIHPDPVDPRFRKLWKEAGYSTAQAPVFGGYTANSEFEALCGFPVTDNAVFFEGWLRNDAPCLPAYLDDAGYESIAAHPNYAAFWNRVNAYQRIGFDQYWSQNDFVLDDMNREFLSDASLYRQVWDKLQLLPENTPQLAYIVTFFGHLDYPLSASRPEVIDIGVENPMLKGYVNQVYYKSRELMDFVEKIRKEDPDAVIALFGDHLPFLGANHKGFVEEGLFTQNKANFDARMFQTYVSTPLIIIDGNNGPVRVGKVPLYQLPARILDRIGDRNTGFLELADSAQLRNIRPLAGLSLYLPEQGQPVLCKQQTDNEDARCPEILQATSHLTTLRDDLFTGEQYNSPQ